MTKLLEEAIEKVRALPEADQDTVAEILLAVASKRKQPVRLDDSTRAAVQQGASQARRGEFVSEEDMAALFNVEADEVQILHIRHARRRPLRQRREPPA